MSIKFLNYLFPNIYGDSNATTGYGYGRCGNDWTVLSNSGGDNRHIAYSVPSYDRLSSTYNMDYGYHIWTPYPTGLISD